MIENNLKIPILMYHEIIDEADFFKASKKIQYSYVLDKMEFRRQIAYLSENGFKTLSVEELLHLLQSRKAMNFSGEKYIVLTFDDGFLGNYENAFPILQDYGFTGNFFLISGKAGKDHMMSWTQIREMGESGMFFGSHTESHSQLGCLSTEGVFRELDRSKKTIEDKTGAKVEYLSLPHGSYNRHYKPAALRAGYLGGCTSAPGLNGPSTNPFFLNRMNVPGKKSLDYFIGLCEKNGSIYKRAIARKRFLNSIKALIGESLYLSMYSRFFGIENDG